jgi:hypothetical protein
MKMAMVQCTKRSSDVVYRAASELRATILAGIVIRARRKVDNRGGGGVKDLAGDGFSRGQRLIRCTS